MPLAEIIQFNSVHSYSESTGGIELPDDDWGNGSIELPDDNW